ncbi:MAG: class I SAM-dependent methyltransferase [Bacteroidales bacterium]|jgi:2-polyprenyl-3-methyl-5-hydroxy-6-metoxy-1,4-benzoquinol methylase|nr:class I SAM-dependent methyltransferase [Bacteroidales bacterium]
MAEVRSCPVCGGSDFSDLFAARDHLVTGGSFRIAQCCGCGLVVTADPPEEHDIGSYYVSDDYISHSDKKQNLTELFYHLARKFMLGRKFRLVRRATGKSTGTIVDIGSGTGYFASFMQHKGWNVTGVELNDRAREFSAAKFGIRTLTPAGISDLKDASADCVTLWHVLEHLYDPEKWMGEIHRILAGDGRCIIALPNIESSDAQWFGENWAALDVPRHLWHFSPDTLVRLAEEHGFACEAIHQLPLDLFYISALSYRNRGRRLALLRGIATGLFLAVVNLFRRNKASSLIYVLSKQKL